jgi:hypothetical protein
MQKCPLFPGDDDGAKLAPLLVTAVGVCLSVADMGRCVRSSLLHPAALAGGVQGHEKAPLAHKLPSTADPLPTTEESNRSLAHSECASPGAGRCCLRGRGRHLLAGGLFLEDKKACPRWKRKLRT